MSNKNVVNYYRLDKNNLIFDVNSSWNKFASENEGQSVFSENVVGRNIFEFIKGDPTRMWYETIITLARMQGNVVERPYRCDSPDLKRFMRMRIIPESDSILRLEHEVIGIEPRGSSVNFEFNRVGRPDYRLRCSICGRIRDGEEWKEAGHGNEELHIVVIYGVCDDCLQLL
jgi:hypothetical protein